jgi:hypothetical protein
MNTLIEDAKEVAQELREKVIQSGGNPNDASDVALTLACTVLFSDGRLQPKESAFLRALLPDGGTELVEPRASHFCARWSEIRDATPAFLVCAVAYDRTGGTHLADHVIDHIEAIALRASAVAEPVATDGELAPIREYCGFLRRRVVDLRR